MYLLGCGERMRLAKGSTLSRCTREVLCLQGNPVLRLQGFTALPKNPVLEALRRIPKVWEDREGWMGARWGESGSTRGTGTLKFIAF